MAKKGNTSIERILASKVNRLELREDLGNDIIKWGKKNDWGNYLLGLATSQSEHGAILKTKAKYLTGLEIETDNLEAQKFLKYANPKESWLDLSKKLDIDDVTFGAVAVKVIPNVFGKPLYFYHVDYGKLRVSRCGNYLDYSNDWQVNEYIEPRIRYPRYYDGIKKPSILILMDYFPTSKRFEEFYAKPSYNSTLTDIDTYVRISTYFNNLVQNNFGKSAIVTVFKDDPTDPEKQYIKANVKNETEGEESAGGSLVVFTDRNGKGAEVQELSGSNLDKQYQEVMKNLREKIIIAHEINPALAGLATDGKLGISHSKEIQQAHELYIKKWAIPAQAKKIGLLEKMFSLKTGQPGKELFKIKQLDWIAEELDYTNPTLQNILSKDEIRSFISKKFNLELQDSIKVSNTNDSLNSLSPLVATKVLEKMSDAEIRSLILLPSNTPESQVQQTGNEFMSKLSRRQISNMMRLVDDYEQGKKNLNQTIILLKAFGLTEEQAKQFISLDINEGTTEPTQMSKCGCNVKLSKDKRDKENLFIKLAYENAHDINEEDEVLETFEVTPLTMDINLRMAAQPKFTVNQLRNAILTQFRGNPEITAEEISELFGVDVAFVQEQIEWLVSKRLLDSNVNGLNPTEKGFDKKNKEIKEVYTEYYYDKREGVSGPVILPTTRDFCKQMYALHSENKKALTLKQIERIKNEFGDNAWDYSGGFWNDGKEIQNKCRHAWFGRTKVRTIKR
ncbi:MAG: hypothetical protein IM600_18750 [Bacteroidetes bacterium]|nr:hypothetical protein [Bacteroidota bacterium]